MNSNTPNSDRIPLFLHIPKTGGTTLKHCIYHQCKADEYYESEEGMLVDGIYYYPAGLDKEPDAAIPAAAIRALERHDIRAVVGHFSFGIHTYIHRPSTYITLLRDPVDRLVSLYYHIRRDSDTSLHEIVS